MLSSSAAICKLRRASLPTLAHLFICKVTSIHNRSCSVFFQRRSPVTQVNKIRRAVPRRVVVVILRNVPLRQLTINRRPILIPPCFSTTSHLPFRCNAMGASFLQNRICSIPTSQRMGNQRVLRQPERILILQVRVVSGLCGILVTGAKRSFLNKGGTCTILTVIIFGGTICSARAIAKRPSATFNVRVISSGACLPTVRKVIRRRRVIPARATNSPNTPYFRFLSFQIRLRFLVSTYPRSNLIRWSAIPKRRNELRKTHENSGLITGRNPTSRPPSMWRSEAAYRGTYTRRCLMCCVHLSSRLLQWLLWVSLSIQRGKYTGGEGPFSGGRGGAIRV